MDLRDGKPEISGLTTASFGTRTPGRADGSGQGIFARWHWDGTTLTAEVDRYGFFGLFCCVTGEGVRLSPSIFQLAEQGCDLTADRRSLSVFHRLGFFINDDTPFEHIKVLPPGGKLTWRDGKVTINAPSRSVKPNNINRAAAVDGFIDLFRKSMARTLDAWDGPIALPLSGGRDSRHILLELAHQGRKPEACITFHHGGGSLNTEAKAARAICEAVGVRHELLGHARSRQSDNFRAITLTQLCADEHAQMMPLHDYFLDTQAATYDGIAGDTLSGAVPNADFERCADLARAGNFHEVAKILISGNGRIISATGDPRGAGALYSPDQDEEATDYIAQSIAQLADTPDPFRTFFFLNRTRREISFVARGILSSAEAVFCPYLDEDLAEFCLTLPFGLANRREKSFHDEVTEKAYPAFADVPFEEGFTSDPPPRPPLRHKINSLADMARVSRFLAIDSTPTAQFRALLGRGRPLKTGPNEMFHIHNQLVETLTPERARAVVSFADRLEAKRPRFVVSDSYTPETGPEAHK